MVLATHQASPCDYRLLWQCKEVGPWDQKVSSVRTTGVPPPSAQPSSSHCQSGRRESNTNHIQPTSQYTTRTPSQLPVDRPAASCTYVPCRMCRTLRGCPGGCQGREPRHRGSAISCQHGAGGRTASMTYLTAAEPHSLHVHIPLSHSSHQ